MTKDPLDAVFDTPEKLEGQLRERLAQMLIPFAVIDPENGTFHPKTAWKKLSSKRKILIYLLARLALATKNPEFINGVSPIDIENETGMPGGTIRPRLKELSEERIAIKTKENLYLVNPSTISFDNAWDLMEEVLPK